MTAKDARAYWKSKTGSSCSPRDYLNIDPAQIKK